MSLLSRLDLLEPSSFLYKEASSFLSSTTPSPLFDDPLVLEEHRRLRFGCAIPTPLDLDLDLRWCFPFPPICDGAADLLRIERYAAAIRAAEAEACLSSLADRVAALELGFARAAVEKTDRRYKWEADAKDERGAGRKWKCVAEAKADGERRLKWQVDLSGGEGRGARTYSFEAASAIPEKKKGKKKEKEKKVTRVVEITEPEPEPGQGAVVLRKAFIKSHRKGKGKELSPQDAALIIQKNFRTYVLRQSQVLCEHRSLAVAKAKLKEIRVLFSNFSYRRHVASDAEERQKFSEKIIVLLLTVDAIEGADYMVRAAKRSMVQELEAMLEVVDPLPAGKLGSLKRRKFDLPEFSAFQREMAAGVSEVVQLINQGEGSCST